MLAVSPVRSNRDEKQGENSNMERFCSTGVNDDFGDDDLLDTINFDDLFVATNDGDILPDMDPEMLAELELSESEMMMISSALSVQLENNNKPNCSSAVISGQGSGTNSGAVTGGKERVSTRDEYSKEHQKVTKSKNINSEGKRKVKKYRSHRKHLLERQAEAASWIQRTQLFGRQKRVVTTASPWQEAVPTMSMGFPSIITPMHQNFRPLHVWGHPTMDHSFLFTCPKNLPISYCHPHHQRRFGCAHVQAILSPPNAMYKVDPGIGVPTGQPGPRPIFDLHPSKESIDEAIGDVLSKPWLPLPLGLKAPALDNVMGELNRYRIPKIPPFCA